jgi:nucleoid DNA-binding protein
LKWVNGKITVRIIFDLFAEALTKDDNVTMTGLGMFNATRKKTHRRADIGINKEVRIPIKNIVEFRLANCQKNAANSFWGTSLRVRI